MLLTETRKTFCQEQVFKQWINKIKNDYDLKLFNKSYFFNLPVNTNVVIAYFTKIYS